MAKKKNEENEETVAPETPETAAEETAVEAAADEAPAVEEPATEEAPAAEVEAAPAEEAPAEAAPVAEEKPKKAAPKAPKASKAAKKAEKAAEPEERVHKRAERVGIVSSDKMTKTVTVRVDRLVKHPLYHKYIKRRKKFMAHDELGAKTGDKVRIIETRPLSARKRWRVVEILQKAEL